MLFTWRGSVLKKIYPRLILLFLFSWLVFLFHYFFPTIIMPLNIAAFTLLGISLAIFLGFCNSAAYDRYWEGRKLWGSLMIHSRSLSFQFLHYIEEGVGFSKADKQVGINLIIAYAYALKKQLRNEADFEDLKRLVAPEVLKRIEKKRFVPAALLNEITHWIHIQKQAGRIDSITQARMDQNVNELSLVLGGCERIVHTGIPFAYFVLLDRTVYIYCFILPFGLIETINWAMPFFVTFVGYSFIALDAIVAEIAEPFGTEENDLALTQICQNIEHSLAEIGDLPLPEIDRPDTKFVIH